MSKVDPRKPNYMGIYMYSSHEKLTQDTVDALLGCLEDRLVFAPEAWGPSENVRLPYQRKETLRAWKRQGGLACLYLVRKRVAKYEASVDDVDQYFTMKVDGGLHRKHWPAYFDLADQLAAILRPRYATAHIVWPSMHKGSEVARLRTVMNACGVVYPVEFRPNGPLGLGLRTYFGADVLEFIGRDTLLGAPAVVTEQPWGGVRVDLWRELDELDGSDALVQSWKAAMDYFRPKDVFAHGTIKDERYVSFEGTKSWRAFRKPIIDD